MNTYSRPLFNSDLLRHFLRTVLQYDYESNCKSNILERIATGEKNLASLTADNSQTLHSTSERGDEFLDDTKRWALRKKIISELLSTTRPDNDDDINIGIGGALPKSALQSNKQAIIIIGLPASGKSTIASSIADEYGAIILDSDYAKRKIPEYYSKPHGATVVHEESSEIIFGFSENDGNLRSVYETCLEKGHNIIIPKIGQSAKNILNLSITLTETNKYDVHLISIELIKKEATIRALQRFDQTNRYVPLGMIFDHYGNDTMLSYYYLRTKHLANFKSFGALSTNVPLGEAPLCTDIIGESPLKKYQLNNKEILL